MSIEIKNIPTVDIWPNTGQIPGLPQNPRFIRDERYEKLVKSIQDDPEMLDLRECIVFPYAAAFVVIAGNMRLRATIEVMNMDEVAYSELLAIKKADPELDFKSWLAAINTLRSSKAIPCKVLPANTPVSKLKAYVIKDNVGFGQDSFDLLANEWDQQELEDWGMIIPDLAIIEDEEEKEPKASAVKFTIVFDDLQVYDTVKLEVEELLKGYPGALLKE
jgi:hypothetical protein